MNFRRFIDKNNKLIWYILLIVGLVLLLIKWTNSHYENKEEMKKMELNLNIAKEKIDILQEITENDLSTESYSEEISMASFVNYCNKRELEKAYKMLTEECKKAMFPTIEDFERIYIKNIYNIERTFQLVRWSTEENKSIYLVTLYGDLLATGGKANTTQEYCTFIRQEDGTYKLNINNYIYGEKRNIKTTQSGISVIIEAVDIYEEYERAQITIINNTTKSICLTGNKYRDNIYLQNSSGTEYSSLNSIFDNEEIVMKPGGKRTVWVEFNKVYSSTNQANYLVLSDVILDYEEYKNIEDKKNYSNRKSLKFQY